MSKRLVTAALALLALPGLVNGVFLLAFPRLTHAAFGQSETPQISQREDIHKFCDDKGGQFVENGSLYSCAWHRADCAADGRCGEAQTTKANLAVRAPAVTDGVRSLDGSMGEQNLYDHFGNLFDQSCANRPPLDRCEDVQVTPSVSRK